MWDYLSIRSVELEVKQAEIKQVVNGQTDNRWNECWWGPSVIEWMPPTTATFDYELFDCAALVIIPRVLCLSPLARSLIIIVIRGVSG